MLQLLADFACRGAQCHAPLLRAEAPQHGAQIGETRCLEHCTAVVLASFGGKPLLSQLEEAGRRSAATPPLLRVCLDCIGHGQRHLVQAQRDAQIVELLVRLQSEPGGAAAVAAPRPKERARRRRSRLQ